MDRQQQASRQTANAHSASQPAPTEPRSTTSGERGLLLRERYSWLQRFSDEELEKVSFCETGDALRPGEKYFDISHPENGAFVARPGLLVPEGSCLVAQRDVSPQIWEKLTRFP
jgi:hypothetical protein